jgi:hypothetical protein
MSARNRHRRRRGGRRAGELDRLLEILDGPAEALCGPVRPAPPAPTEHPGDFVGAQQRLARPDGDAFGAFGP